MKCVKRMKKNIKKILLIVYSNKFGVLNVQRCKTKNNFFTYSNVLELNYYYINIYDKNFDKLNMK